LVDFSLNGLAAQLKSRLGEAGYTRRIQAALALAYEGHSGQFREQADPQAPPTPYIVHPVGVALLAIEFYASADLQDDFEDVVAACLTHDLLEDTAVTPYDLERATSRRTLELVNALSKPPAENYPSHVARNAAFMDSLKQAGRTAIFIKICDSLHNLSRPEQTPKSLLKKTTQKGRDYLRDLWSTVQLGEPLAARYHARLGAVEAFIAEARDAQFSRSGYQNIESVFSHCRERARRKVLEVHDICELLAEVTGADGVSYSSITAFLGSELLDQAEPATGAVRRLMTDGGDVDVDVATLPVALRDKLAPATRVISVAPQSLGETSGRFFFLQLNGRTPAWVTPSAVSVLVAFLSQRAQLHNAGRVGDMADLLRELDLNLDPQLATNLGLSIGTLKDLASRMAAAAAAKGLLDVLILGRFPASVDVRIERREVRIKAADSLVRKITSKQLAAEDVEDLLGYRLVVRNRVDKSKVSAFLLERLSQTGLSVAAVPELKVVKTKAGYVADHILFKAHLGEMFTAPVPVEIQVRTILDDAWARVSHAINYKKNNVMVRRNDKILRKLRDYIDEVEISLI
jgi:hypothetical protein